MKARSKVEFIRFNVFGTMGRLIHLLQDQYSAKFSHMYGKGTL